MYNYSTDYDKLWELVEAGKDPICMNGKYLFQFWQDDIEKYLDNESFIDYCKHFNLRWIDPQPVHPHPDLNKRNIERAYQLGAKSIIEQLKGLAKECERPTGDDWYLSWDNIEAIINQNK